MPVGPQNALVYRVRVEDPDAHVYEVSCLIPEPDSNGQVISLAAWTPGSYLIRNFARHVIAAEAEAAGEAVSIRKVDKSTWHVPRVDGPLLIRLKIYGRDAAVRGAWIDRRFGFFDGACLLPRVHGAEARECVLHIDPPAEDWQLATSLARLTGAELEFGAFRASGYLDLIDHPVLMGTLAVQRFDVQGIPHGIAVVGAPDTDLAALADDLRPICAWQMALFGGPAPVDRYWFLVRAAGSGYGGLEHRYSCALLCDRDDLRLAATADRARADRYRRFLGLASHEYFHLWNVKRIRPAELVGGDLASEAYTRQLWIFEGITSYYDDLSLLRAGLIGEDSYLELLGRMLTQVYRSGGRRRQTLEEASFDAWIKFYQPDENTPNATVSYYAKGAMTALALDLELRLRSGGKHSLDEVMRALWLQYGREDSPGLNEGVFERLVEDTCGLDFSAFFHQALRTTVDLPVGILLAQFGVRLHLRPAEAPDDRGGRPPAAGREPQAWLGFKPELRGDAVHAGTIWDDGPARPAGLAPGDELLALAGERWTRQSQQRLLRRLELNQPVPLLVARDGDVIELAITPCAPPRDTCYLSIEPDANGEARSRRERWLARRSLASRA